MERRKLVLRSSDRVHRRRRGRQRRLGHDRCRGSSGRRRRRQSIFTKFRGVYAMQRQSRSLGDELWRSEQCQNECHFVASDGRRASIIAGNVTALLQLASALQAASRATRTHRTALPRPRNDVSLQTKTKTQSSGLPALRRSRRLQGRPRGYRSSRRKYWSSRLPPCAEPARSCTDSCG